MPHPDEALIHAWLDGELDAAEAARVERLVNDDPAWAAAAAEARGLIAASERIVSALDHVPAGVVPGAPEGPAPLVAAGRQGPPRGGSGGQSAPGGKGHGAAKGPPPWLGWRAAAAVVVVVGAAALLTDGPNALLDVNLPGASGNVPPGAPVAARSAPPQAAAAATPPAPAVSMPTAAMPAPAVRGAADADREAEGPPRAEGSARAGKTDIAAGAIECYRMVSPDDEAKSQIVRARRLTDSTAMLIAEPPAFAARAAGGAGGDAVTRGAIAPGVAASVRGETLFVPAQGGARPASRVTCPPM
ncbi:MAG: zf-HC2 domain-containing protein [Gemmatimonadaceae bacterium]|nr:zf-HC2 domain-containing protein [Gemmatimonadaceae bacterium]